MSKTAGRTTVCEGCGDPFEQSGKGRPRRFCVVCSPADPVAATAAWRTRTGHSERRTAARFEARPERECDVCGELFKALGSQLRCSRRCMKRAENRRYRAKVRERRLSTTGGTQ